MTLLQKAAIENWKDLYAQSLFASDGPMKADLLKKANEIFNDLLRVEQKFT